MLENYNDNRSSFSDDIKTEEKCSISEAEVQAVIQKLTRNKATVDDNIPAEFIQYTGTGTKWNTTDYKADEQDIQHWSYTR